jgi:hypothetical protein
VAVAGCVLLAGASVAETPEERGREKKSNETHVSLHVKASAESTKANKWSMERHANPNVGKEETKELLRGKRPK